MNKCHLVCKGCEYLNTKTDNKGYPWGYECVKYNSSVFLGDFYNTKEF